MNDPWVNTIIERNTQVVSFNQIKNEPAILYFNESIIPCKSSFHEPLYINPETYNTTG